MTPPNATTAARNCHRVDERGPAAAPVPVRIAVGSGIDADRGESERHHDHRERQACCRPGESRAGKKERERHVPHTLAGEVGVPPPTCGIQKPMPYSPTTMQKIEQC